MTALWLLLRPFAHYIVGGLGILTLITGFAWQQQSVGVRKERAKTERDNNAARELSDRARTSSKSSRVRGSRDPYTVD